MVKIKLKIAGAEKIKNPSEREFKMTISSSPTRRPGFKFLRRERL